MHLDAFFALLRAGLWERDVNLSLYEPFDFEKLYDLAEEQSVVGLLAAGLEHIQDIKFTKKEALPFLKSVFSLESRNISMDIFIRDIISKLEHEHIYSVLIKGQGVAQCYERPLWRSSGDIDFFFDKENYERAKLFFAPIAQSVDPEDKLRLHQSMTINSWVVELHGIMHTDISNHINKVVDDVQHSIFEGGSIRTWRNGEVDVYLPAPNEDVIIVFTHFLHHFFVGGVGLRQIADWCRLLWTFRDSINHDLLASRLRKMKILSEWKAFASFVVSYMGMPKEAIPLYEDSPKYSRKSERICKLVLKTGNFGHNIDNSYRTRYPVYVERIITLGRRFFEFSSLSFVFPWDGPRFFLTYLYRRTIA